MANPTSNFGWQMPTATDLVTDLPADFEVFGQAVDTDFVDLLGGTTGQVLSKTSATDLDFTWINNDQGDITGLTAGTGISVTSPTGPVPTVAIDTTITVDKTTAQTLTNKTLTSPALTTPTISTATTNGDMLYGTGSGALARLGIGSSAQVLTVASGIPSWATPAAGTAVYVKLINNGSNYSTTSGTSSAVSTANARITATPTGTTATVMLQGFSNNSGNTTAEWTISTGGTGTIMGFTVYNSSYSGTAVNNAVCIVSITGLTAGTSYNFDWFYKITGTGTTTIIGDTAAVYPKMVLIC